MNTSTTPMTREDVQRHIEDFIALCGEKGLKATHQRIEIYRALITTTEHPDANDIYQRVRQVIPTVSLDTVYRNLRLLAEHGLISIVGMSQERLRFDANMAPHHHFVCARCGCIRDFSEPRFDALEAPATARAYGEVLGLHVEIKGICSRCGA